MRVQTRENTSPHSDVQKEISEHVDERGFYLYEWISREELRMSVQADYLSIVKKSSIPLAIITFIAGIFGLSLGIPGVLIAVSAVLMLFYSIVCLYLVYKMIRRSYLYTRGGDVIITDNHYITGGRVIEKTDFSGQKEAFHVMETLFKEPLFERSALKEYIALEKKSLFERLKDIAYGGGKIIERIGRSKDSGGIIIALIVAGFLYGGMMALVYFIGVFFVMIGAHIFSAIAHRILLLTNNLEHTVQDLFTKISDISYQLKSEKETLLSLLSEAKENQWKDNLSGKIDSSFTNISSSAKNAVDGSSKLEKLLQQSHYQSIFNFKKYSSWVRTQILEPLKEILSVLKFHQTLIQKSQLEIKTQIQKIDEPSLQKPLMAQNERLMIQSTSIERMIVLLEGYQKKLYH